ncbi:MAG: hypothetical protein Q9196_006919, partial [Gyalolechia fulgens]
GAILLQLRQQALRVERRSERAQSSRLQNCFRSQAKTTIMTSAVGWQVDLPGLSSLVLNMGAAGLKKIAQAGVDIHTLLCFGEIAELCPASLEYRREINNCRQKQRKQSFWIYKVVEIGTASNFIADELLKKRAGENIVALMSTILPILTEDDCDSFILRLFETSKIHADKTPGLGQLQSFRDAIQSLAQELDFKDRTYQYHVFLGQLRSQDQQPPCTSIPNVELLVQVILMLQKIVLDEDARYALTYRGWTGAAWVISYARHVLGLPVCVLRTAQDSVPINGSYQNSRVYVYIFEQEARCELVLDGKVSDLVTPTDSISRSVWVVDLETVNLRNTYIPDEPSLREAASVIVRSLALYFAARRSVVLATEGEVEQYHLLFKEGGVLQNTGLIPYTIYCLPSIRRRALKIVDLMGFRVKAEMEPDTHTWQEFLLEKREDPDSEEFFLQPGPRWVQWLQPDNDRSSRVLSTAKYQGFGNQGRILIERMFALADTAACLAFSDWGENLQLISSRILEDGFPYEYAFYRLHKATEEEERSVEGEDSKEQAEIRFRLALPFYKRWGLAELTKTLSYLVVGGGMEKFKLITAFEYQSVVFARAAAMEDSINLDAKFIHLYPGHIVMLGQRREEIRTPVVSFSSMGRADFRKPPGHETAEYYPSNQTDELSIKSTLNLVRKHIEVKRSLAIRDAIYDVKCPSLDTDEIFRLRITSKCSHSYYSRAAVPSDGKDIIQSVFCVGQIPAIPEHLRDELVSVIHLQPVDRNPCGQWVSVHDSGFQPYNAGFPSQLRILQRDMCTQCVVDLIRGHEKDIVVRRPTYYSIIPGRMQGEEDMGEDVIDTETHHSPTETNTE